MKRRVIGLILGICAVLLTAELSGGFLAIANRASAQAPATAELPRVFLNTDYPAIGGATITVPAGASLQNALNQAQPGDTLVLQAGAVFTGNFTLPAKTGSAWIVIRTSNVAALPPVGSRLDLSYAGSLPKIVTPNTMPAIKAASAAHHYRLVGIEVGISSGVSLNYGIVALGDTGSAQASLSQAPHDLIIDRCYIHGNSTGDVSRGVALNSAATAIIDSTIANCHGVGFDTQAIGGWNGPGPFKIVNNFLEGAAENFMLGGADPSIPNLVPSDIEFRRNYCSKPLSWCATEPTYAGIHWGIKNIFELKNAQRVLVDGNTFENCWVDGQAGIAVQFTPRNQDGTAPWSTVQDVTWTNNIVRHAAAGINILGRDNNNPSQLAQRIDIKNNLFDDIGGARWGGNGRLLQIIDGPAAVLIDHNTALQTSNVITADGAASAGFVFTNNLAPHNDYGVIGSNYGVGASTLNYYFPACVFSRNVLIAGPAAAYPATNFFPSSIAAVGFVDLAAGNYRLGIGSPYRNAATDGTDIGANFDAITAAIAGQPADNQPPQVSIGATPASGTAPLLVAFTSNATDPDGSIVGYNWNFGDGQASNAPAPSHTYQLAGNYTAQLTVTDNMGATATSSVFVTVTNTAVQPGPPTIVLYASEAPARAGKWQVVADPTAAGGARIWNPDKGAAKITTAAASPADYFEVTFTAAANTPYHLWMRGIAQNDSPYNDSVHLQFSDSVDAGGNATFRIGTTASTVVNLEEDLNYGLKGWGWQDNGWGSGVMGANVYFAANGTHTLRVQVREDGFSIDQIVLSSTTYLNVSPGALKRDTVILPKTSAPATLTIFAVSPSSGPASGGMPLSISGDGFLPGVSVRLGNDQAASVNVVGSQLITAVLPPHSAGVVDLAVITPDGMVATLPAGFRFLAANRPPQVNPTASVTLGNPPLTVFLNANAVDPDGNLQSVTWDFGDHQTGTGSVSSHTYANPGILTARVVATDTAGASATGSVTITVIEPPPTVGVTTPVAAQQVVVGSTVAIRWSTFGANIVTQRIQLSTDAGISWRDVVTGLPGSTKSYNWKVPNLPTRTARVRVTVLTSGGSSAEALNPGDFSIAVKAK